MYGADAVGKTTVAWEIYSTLAARGVPSAYVDTDYLRFCSTTPDDDASSLVAANLRSMWPNFAAAGASCLVVSGVVVTPEEHVRFADAIPGAVLTLCHLRASADTLAARILRRGRIEGAESDGAVSELTIDGLREYGERAGRFASLLDPARSRTSPSTPTTCRCRRWRDGCWPGSTGGRADGRICRSGPGWSHWSHPPHTRADKDPAAVDGGHNNDRVVENLHCSLCPGKARRGVVSPIWVRWVTGW